MKKDKISISSVSIISLVLLTSIVFCFFGFIYYNHQKQIKLSELDANLATTADQLSKGLSIAVWNFDEDEITGVMQSGLLDKSITAITIEYGEKNQTVLTLKRDSKNNYSTSKIKPKALSGSITIERNICYMNDNVGKLYLQATPEYVYKTLKEELELITLFILFLTLLVILGVYFIFYLIVIKPLKFFEKFSLSINFENYNSSKIIERKFFRELDHLSYSLQMMVASLNASYKKIESSERKFKEMSNLLPQTVFECDLNGNLIFLNEIGFKLLGLTKSQLERGISIYDVTAKENHELIRKNISLIIHGHEFPDGNEYSGIKTDGSTFPFIVYSSVIMEDGKAVGLRGVGIDVSELRRNEAAYNELVQLNFMKEKEAEKLKTLSLIEGQENERLRISREIHDGIGQIMTAVKLSIESIDPKSINADIEKFEYTKSLIYEVIAELRQVSGDLSPTFLYQYGLHSAVSQLVSGISRMNIIAIELNSNIQNTRFSSLVEITLYRIIQEALNNTLKYAKAKNLKITLLQDAEFLELTIEDDGIGFDINAQMEINPKGGNGLMNMASRADLIGANFKITTSRGQGFHISLQIPLENLKL